MLDDARLVQYDAAENLRVDQVQPVVVDDVDAAIVNVGTGAAHLNLHADLSAFCGGLVRYGQRRKNQHWHVRVAPDFGRPCKLHPRLAESRIGKDRCSAAL